ncbi:hypothetical protein [Streptomyces sp. NBC_01235]|uniref:hypothetical protein n=1 Tax=Streptomyces sp. NBC_01235 TaxID=2903788 RepID=UPI003FA35208
MANSAIARRLVLSTATIKTQVHRCMSKLTLNSRAMRSSSRTRPDRSPAAPQPGIRRTPDRVFAPPGSGLDG